MAAAAGIPRTATLRDLGTFVAAFSAALAADELTTLVAKVEAKGPPVFPTDLPMLENRFQFARHLKGLEVKG
jgi:hypothetical protein